MALRKRLGLVLMAVGVLLLLTITGHLPSNVFMLMLAVGFIGAYALVGGRNSYGNVGFLIPGTVLVAIWSFARVTAAGVPKWIEPGLFFGFLSLSFWAVYLVHTVSFRGQPHGERFWPVYPAIGLLLFGGIINASETWGTDFPFRALNYLWVVGLIVAGAYLVIVKRKPGEGC